MSLQKHPTLLIIIVIFMPASPEPNRLNHAHHVRMLFVALGMFFVGGGVLMLGIFLPVLPTTPFMLLAADCFARSSEKFYQWLPDHLLFRRTVREWQEYRSIPRRTKWVAILTMAATLCISIVFVVPRRPKQGVLTLLGIVPAVYLYRIPSRD